MSKGCLLKSGIDLKHCIFVSKQFAMFICLDVNLSTLGLDFLPRHL